MTDTDEVKFDIRKNKRLTNLKNKNEPEIV